MTIKGCNLVTEVAFKNSIKCITKIDGATIDNAEGLDLVISMYKRYKAERYYLGKGIIKNYNAIING